MYFNEASGGENTGFAVFSSTSSAELKVSFF